MCNPNSKANLNPDAPIECVNCGKAIPAYRPRHPNVHEHLCEGCIVPVTKLDRSCEVCGATESLGFYPLHGGRHGEYLCPTHSQARALNKAAQDHLAALVEQTVREWVHHWGRTNISLCDISDALDCYYEMRGSEPLEKRAAFVDAVLAGEPTKGI